MKVLALDTGTKTGFCLGENGKVLESGMQNFTPSRGDSPGMRFLRFRLWLEKLVADTKPDLVVYERAHHRGGAATEVAVGLTTRVQEICSTANITYAAVHSGTLKKYATGKGKGEKIEMRVALEKVRDRLPKPDYEDDNEIDAIWICLMAMDGSV